MILTVWSNLKLPLKSLARLVRRALLLPLALIGPDSQASQRQFSTPPGVLLEMWSNNLWPLPLNRLIVTQLSMTIPLTIQSRLIALTQTVYPFKLQTTRRSSTGGSRRQPLQISAFTCPATTGASFSLTQLSTCPALPQVCQHS
jgi:hypothetical protein